MNARKNPTLRIAAFSLSLLAAGLAHAQGPVALDGSTDIYSTNFQAVHAASPAATANQQVSGSTDLYGNGFAASFGRADAPRVAVSAARAGSTDIYSTNFQSVYM